MNNANINRMSTSSSLNTHSIWKNSIGYDPYAGQQEDQTNKSTEGVHEARKREAQQKDLVSSMKIGGDQRGTWRGSKPLRGVFAEPRFGYSHKVSTNEYTPKGNIDDLSSLSDLSSDSDSSHGSSGAEEKKKRKKKKKSKKRKSDSKDKRKKKRKRDESSKHKKSKSKKSRKD